jgi:hypothetical protein
MGLQNCGCPSQTIRITKMNALGENNDRVVPMAVHHSLDESLQARPVIPKLPATAKHDRLITDSPLQPPRTVAIWRSCISDRNLQLVLQSLELRYPDQMVSKVAMARVVEQGATLSPKQARDLR